MNTTKPCARFSLLLIHPGTLGDVLLSLQAIRAIRTHFPGHHSILLTRAEVGNLLFACGEIQETWDLAGTTLGNLIASPGSLPAVVQSVLWRCSHVIGWLNRNKAELRKTLLGFGIDKILIQSPREEHLQARHVEERYLETLRQFSIAPLQNRLPLCFADTPENEDQEVGEMSQWSQSNKPLVVIHPGSGSPHKCVSPLVLKQVVEGLSDYLHQLILLGGPDDAAPLSNLQVQLGTLPYSTIMGKDLVSVAKLLSQATVYIGHDSGITHVAASLGICTIALFGPTDPMQWGPRSKNVTILKATICQCGDWDAVQHCQEQPCLQFQPSAILDVVKKALAI